MPKRPRGRPPTDHPLEVRIMYRAAPTDVALLDGLVDALRARASSPDPSSPPTRGSVIRWLVEREAKAMGVVIPAPSSPRRRA